MQTQLLHILGRWQVDLHITMTTQQRWSNGQAGMQKARPDLSEMEKKKHVCNVI